MSAPRPIEMELLAAADSILRKLCSQFPHDPFEARLQLLEACASRFGGFSLSEYQKAFRIAPLRKPRDLIEKAALVTAHIDRTPIHPALALSALARETLNAMDRRNKGVFHTDFRLAERLAQIAAPRLTHASRVIDPACGAGILLVALTVALCGNDRTKISEWFATGLCAADLSARSLRAALLSLASLTDDLAALVKMRERWFCGDSLFAAPQVWQAMAPHGFDAVIGNPPWERIKLSRHEFLKSSGAQRHYGAESGDLDQDAFDRRRKLVAAYSRRLLSHFPDLLCGEPDLYVAFTQMFYSLCRPEGVVAALVPGGLIRSQGTQTIRQRLFSAAELISISVIDNRARFFEIDSRFKFLALGLVKAAGEKSQRCVINLFHERGTAQGLTVYGSVAITRNRLRSVRKDWSVPEVRDPTEWKIYQKIAAAGCSWDDANFGWKPYFCREVDMTKERRHFLSKPVPSALPLVEGRMVHQHRFGAKAYRAGSGRSAVWNPLPVGGSALRPQFWIKLDNVPIGNQSRTSRHRVGFCDITGQTNERSLMAAVIPPGVVCGNKVPTILFPEDASEDRLFVWTAIANSIPFDWMLRRVVTTTVNYFLLQSVPLPKLTKDGLPWRKLSSAARTLQKLDTGGPNVGVRRRIARLRSQIDAEVAIAYGLKIHDLEIVFRDFPILDSRQPALRGEAKSTVTRDMVLSATAKRLGLNPAYWEDRVLRANEIGAEPYVPSEVAKNKRDIRFRGESATHA